MISVILFVFVRTVEACVYVGWQGGEACVLRVLSPAGAQP